MSFCGGGGRNKTKLWERLGMCRAVDADGEKKEYTRKSLLRVGVELLEAAIYTLSDKSDSCLRTCELWSSSEVQGGGRAMCSYSFFPGAEELVLF